LPIADFAHFASRYLDRKIGNWQSEIGNDFNLRIKVFTTTPRRRKMSAPQIPGFASREVKTLNLSNS
jgi:hypothetical protein